MDSLAGSTGVKLHPRISGHGAFSIDTKLHVAEATIG